MQFKIGNVFKPDISFPGGAKNASGVEENKQIAPLAGIDYECLFDEAVQEYKSRLSRGLNRLTEEDIREKSAKFKEQFKPIDGTERELEAFEEALQKYTNSLRVLAGKQRETYAPSGEKSEDAEAITRGFLHSKLPSNPNLSHQLQTMGGNQP